MAKCKCGHENDRVGVYKTCSKCAEYWKTYYRKNKDAYLAKKREYYDENVITRECLYRRRREAYHKKKAGVV
jgi:hypothetical protein